MKNLNNNNTFEQVVKNKIDNLDLPYDGTGWTKMEQEISRITPKPTGYSLKIISIITAIVVISSVSFFYFNSSTKNNQIAINKEDISNNKQITKLNTDNTSKIIINNDIKPEIYKKESKTIIKPINTKEDKTIIAKSENPQTEKQISSELSQITIVKEATTPKPQNKLPNAEFTISKLQICDNQEIIFTPNEIADSIIYLWEFGDKKTSSKAIATHTYKEGNYSVSLTLQYKNSELSSTHYYNEAVVVYPTSSADFKVEHIINTYSFIPVTTDANINWEFSEGQITEDNLNAFTFTKSGIYPITCIVENDFNCIDKVNKNIEVNIEHYIPMPNAFSPDGDGLNDVFGPPAQFCSDYDLTFKVFDKTGILLFKTNSADNKWTGSAYGSSAILKRNVYVWILITKDKYNNIQTKKGTVSLIK